MRDIPSPLQDRLDSGATTLAHVWVIRRRDGLVQGFTDHDRPLIFNSVQCYASSGLDVTELSEKLGMSTTGGEVAGALSNDAISETDILAGLYDGAQVEIYLVDWQDTSLNIPLRAMVIGEITREDQAFRAELRSIAHQLDEEQGSRYTASCSAELGDQRCGFSISSSQWTANGQVTGIDDDGALVVSGLGSYVSDWFTSGRLRMASGGNAGLVVEVARHINDGTRVILVPWQGFVRPVTTGDTFTVSAGCDKSFATCRARFGNVVNFRGFPAIPGNDYVVSYPVQGEPGYDGSSLGVTS
jgi:uncharacterized phage protein (TIGR02218 family)